MFDNISQSVRVEKPDFVQLVGKLPPGTTAGCKWCFKTIFFNGSFWNHVDGDKHKCERGYGPGPHDIEIVRWEEVEVGKTLFRAKPIIAKMPVHRCKACQEEKLAHYTGEYMFPSLAYDCPAKVATPARGEVEGEGH